MNISIESIKALYKIKLEHLLNNLLKKNSWNFNTKDKAELLELILDKIINIEINEFIKLSDIDLNYQILELFETEKISNFLASIEGIKIKRSNYDIRHKETLRLFLREYFELFFPDLSKKMNFETAQFLDKELIGLFGGHRITDALVLIEMQIEDKIEWILIHWEQQSERQKFFEERMFHCFCGIYFQYRKIVFPIAMFTDSSNWEKPIPDIYKMSLMKYPINDYHYNLIKLKSFKADEFEILANKNPLAYAYLPFTDYSKNNRPYIKAVAINGILKNFKDGQKQATLMSLVEEKIKLNDDEKKIYNKFIDYNNKKFKEVYMFNSLEDYLLHKGREEGKEEGKEEGRDELLSKLIQYGILSGNQLMKIAPLIGLKDASKILDKNNGLTL